MGKTYNYSYIIPYNIDYYRNNLKDTPELLGYLKKECGLDKYELVYRKKLDFLHEESQLITTPSLTYGAIIKQFFHIDTFSSKTTYKSTIFPPYQSEYKIETPIPESIVKLWGVTRLSKIDDNSCLQEITLNINVNIPGGSYIEEKIHREFEKNYNNMPMYLMGAVPAPITPQQGSG